MPIKIYNVSLDPAYDLKRRMATRLQMEPVIAGERLRLRQSRVLTDEQAAINKDWLAELEKSGVIKIEGSVETPALVVPPAPEIPPQEPLKEEEPVVDEPPVIPPFEPPAPPAPPAPIETQPLASSTSSSEATTQPLPTMGRKDDKKRR